MDQEVNVDLTDADELTKQVATQRALIRSEIAAARARVAEWEPRPYQKEKS